MIRKATNEEIDFFENRLYFLQDELLKQLEKEKFYLTGGTCLSRFYLGHRYSEYLDFFFDGNKFTPLDFEQDFISFVTKIKNCGEIEVTVNEKTFKRMFVKKEEKVLKIEFVFEPYPRIGDLVKKRNFLIDTEENIAVNKLTAIYSRKTAKDFYDLYFLLKRYDLNDLIKKVEIKMVPPDYEGLLVSLKESLLEGEVLAKLPITESMFIGFIEDLIKKLLDYAKQF